MRSALLPAAFLTVETMTAAMTGATPTAATTTNPVLAQITAVLTRSATVATGTLTIRMAAVTTIPISGHRMTLAAAAAVALWR